MIAVVLSLVMSGATAEAPHLAMTGWNLAGVTPEFGRVLEDALAARLRAHGGTVATQQDLVAVLGIERQKALLGCETNGCLVELGGALGCDSAVVVSLAKVGGGFRGTARRVSTQTAAVLGEVAVNASSEAGLIDDLDLVAQGLLGNATGEARSPLRWGLLGVGVAGAVASGVLFGLTADRYAAVTAAKGDVQAAANTGRGLQAGAWLAGVVGVAALVGCLVWSLLPGAPVSVALAPGGAWSLVAGGAF